MKVDKSAFRDGMQYVLTNPEKYFPVKEDALPVSTDKVYLIEARKYGIEKSHTYIANVFSDKDKAVDIAEWHHSHRDGIYEVRVHEYDVNDTEAFDKPYSSVAVLPSRMNLDGRSYKQETEILSTPTPLTEQEINTEFRMIISHALLGCDLEDVSKETWDLVFSECTKFSRKMGGIDKNKAVGI